MNQLEKYWKILKEKGENNLKKAPVIDRKKNHYTHARGKFRKSARLSRSFVGIFVGIFDNNLKIVNNISKSG